MKIEIIKCDCCEKEIENVMAGIPDKYNDLCVNCGTLQNESWSLGAREAIEKDNLLTGSIYLSSLLESMDRGVASDLFGSSTLELFDKLQEELKV